MQLEYAKNPVWSNKEQTAIDLTIKWFGINEEFPFTATADDVENHGRYIFTGAVNGEYGTIAQFVEPSTPEPPPVTSITKRQGKLALLDAELLDQVELLLNDPNTPRSMKINYEDSTIWYRNDPLIISMGAALNLTNEEIDQLFQQASKL